MVLSAMAFGWSYNVDPDCTTSFFHITLGACAPGDLRGVGGGPLALMSLGTEGGCLGWRSHFGACVRLP